MADEQSPPNAQPGTQEPSRAGLDDVSDEQAQREAEPVAGDFSLRQFIRRHPIVLGVGAAAVVGGSIYVVRRVRRSLPVRLFRAVTRLSPGELTNYKR